MAEYSRPNGGWRFKFEGLNTKDLPDALGPTKYPYAYNIRGVGDKSIQTRPGYIPQFNTTAATITDMRGYSTLNTDGLPRILARNENNQVYLDTGALITTLAGTSEGVVFIPFRPNQSPQTWMYIGAQGDYKKVSAPNAANAVVVYPVGIKEQQDPPQMCLDSFNFYSFDAVAADWVGAGVMGGKTDGVRLSDTAGSIFEDPASGPNKRFSVQVTDTSSYQRGMTVVFDAGGTPIETVVQDVIPPVNAGGNIAIDAIQYYAGTSGRCIIVPSRTPANSTVPTFAGSRPLSSSIYSDNVISSLRRGSIIELVGSVTENCFVLSVTAGPDGTICFEVVTVGTFVDTDNFNGIPSISVSGITTANAGDTIDTVDVEYATVSAGTATLSQDLSANPFNQAMAPSANTPQQNDYVAFSINIADLAQLVQGGIYFNVDPNTTDYSTNAFYHSFTAADLIFHPPSATSPYTYTTNEVEVVDEFGNVNIIQEQIQTGLTPLPTDQWTTIQIPIASLIRLGNDLSKTLADCNGVQIKLEVLGVTDVAVSSFWVGGGGQADVSITGSPLFYVVRGRNTLTGAKSNPSPVSRYGVSPRRQQVIVSITSNGPDAQADTWDVFRYGGTVPTFRYIGSMPNTGGLDKFTDNFFDTSALGGSLVEYDNFQPWPTVDVPYTATAGTDGAGILTTIQIVGTNVLVIYSKSTTFTDPIPATVLKWLPGTLAIIGGQSAYTLWNRPTAVTVVSPPAAHYTAYLFQFVENIGDPTATVFAINEPNVANASLPYLWGPDAQGTVFGCGDPLRPGSFYFCKSNDPDSAPDAYNQELTSPSEPIMGGEVIDGLSLAASTKRWWALYPIFGNAAQRYQPVERPVGRGMAAPYGHTTDGKNIFFWAEDGIWLTRAGDPGISLTDPDLYNLFPHEGVPGVNVEYSGFTVHAPDYGRASTFRLAYKNSFLYADYQDDSATPRTLVLDMRLNEKGEPRMAWSIDAYAHLITCHYGIETQEGTLLAPGTRYPTLLMGADQGKVFKQEPNHNDDTSPIPVNLSTFEWNCGDERQNNFIGDHYLDLFPGSQVSATPLSESLALAPATLILKGTARVQLPISVGGGQLANFIGILINWEDDFRTQDDPTQLFVYQPSFVPKQETTQDRVTDWDDAGTPNAKFIQGFILEADTFAGVKEFIVRNGDDDVAQQTFAVTFDGQQKIAFSFDTPFVAHNLRIEPQGTVDWIMYGITWVWQPTPESVTTWKTQGTSFGLTGYMHVRKIVAAYESDADVIITFTAYDGTSPAPITLPSTGGLYKKIVFDPTFNKGQIYTMSAVGTGKWRPFFKDWEIHVGQWGRPDSYLIYRNIGGDHGDKAMI